VRLNRFSCVCPEETLTSEAGRGVNESIERDLKPLWQFPVSSRADLVLDCETARDHPGVREFLDLCDHCSGGGLLAFDMLEQKAFMAYWKFLTILRWDADRQDFAFVFFGTGLTVTHGCDFTGHTLAETGDEAIAAVTRQANARVLSERERLFISGSLAWRDRSLLRYHGVIMPLERKGSIQETVTWVCYL
jgi:hypothetical protein